MRTAEAGAGAGAAGRPDYHPVMFLIDNTRELKVEGRRKDGQPLLTQA